MPKFLSFLIPSIPTCIYFCFYFFAFVFIIPLDAVPYGFILQELMFSLHVLCSLSSNIAIVWAPVKASAQENFIFLLYSNFCHSAELSTQLSVILHGSPVRLVAGAWMAWKIRSRK